ncbi:MULTISPECIES: hypothetical protein [unclassified Legionella]|uniref:hypothetical protein n=1 Tax=unclassified Legionella TaxID=2622702 RepID=UPI001054D144|nr:MULTISPECIES: hypothetical protein [unclassified Legionella]MDI9817913.1 hypothetical protein [Legionella sp. PL877]
MGLFAEALEKLKTDIEKVQGRSMEYNDAGFNPDEAKKTFANPEILEGYIEKPAPNTYVNPADSDYPQKVLQAVWNIADLSLKLEKNYPKETNSKFARGSFALTNGGSLLSLRRNFNYLEEATWVPKIVDQRTYEVGQALGIFLDTVIEQSEGCDLHLVSELPNTPAEYKNSYIFITKDDTRKLYYIKSDEVCETVEINNFDLFEEKISNIERKDKTTLHLNKEQIKEVITLNGGHTPENIFDFLSEGERAGVVNTLMLMKNLLDFRMEVYATHTPENIKHYQTTLARKKIWNEEIAPLAKQINEASFTLPKVSHEVNRQLEEELASGKEELMRQVRKLGEHIEILQRMINDVQKTLKPFEEFAEQWHKDNITLNLPETIQISSFMSRLILKPNTKVLEEWLTLYNNSEQPCILEEAAKALRTLSRKGHRDIDDAKNIVAMIQELKERLSAHIEKAIADDIHKYVSSLEDTGTIQAQIKDSSFITGNYPEWELNLDLQAVLDNENKQRTLNQNISTCEQAKKALQEYQQGLEDDKKKLDSSYKDFEQLYPIPDAVPFKPPFQKAQQDAKEKLFSKIKEAEEKHEAIEKLIKTVDVKIRLYKEELSSLDDASRQNMLRNTGQEVTDAFKRTQKTSANLIGAKFQAQLFNEEYTAAKKAITESTKTALSATANKISETQKAIDRHSKTINSAELRKLFLATAQNQLATFKQILEEENQQRKLDVPDSLSKEQLEKYLEPSEEGKSLIDEAFITTQNAKSLGGFNFTNIVRLSRSSFGYEKVSSLPGLINMIEQKLKLIELELEPEANIRSIKKYKGLEVNEDSLFFLNGFSEHAKDEKNRLESELEELNKKQVLLEQRKQKELEGWDSRAQALSQRLNEAETAHHRHEIELLQARLTLDNLQLKYVLDNLQKSASLFEKNFSELSEIGNQRLLETIGNYQTELENLNHLLTAKVGRFATIASLLDDCKGHIRRLEEKFASVKQQPSAEFSQLKDKTSELDKHYQELQEVIADKQTALPQIKALSGIQAEAAALLEDTKGFENKEPQTRTALIQTIATLEKKAAPILEETVSSENAQVKLKHDELDSTISALVTVKTAIRDYDNLLELKKKYAAFADRIQGLHPHMVLARRQLQQEINEFSQSELAGSLKKIRSNQHPAVQTLLFENQEELQSISDYEKRVHSFQTRHTPEDENGEQFFAQLDKKDLLEELALILEGHKRLIKKYHDSRDPKHPHSLKTIRERYAEIREFEDSPVIASLNELIRPCEYKEVEIKKLLDEISKAQVKLSIIEEIYSPDEESKKHPEEMYHQQAFAQAANKAGETYFGNTNELGGLFYNYLQERQKTFWFKDLVRSIAALTFRCFDPEYQPDHDARETYLRELKQAFTTYQQAPMENKQGQYDDLTKLIQKGKERFTPRSKPEQEATYRNSLQAKLKQFETEVEEIHKHIKDIKEEHQSIAATM